MLNSNEDHLRVSVIIPVYNVAKFLDRTINSCINQKYLDELVLVDDHSTDSTWTICMRWKELYPSMITLLKSSEKGNAGPAVARNQGILSARNDWIAFLDADDVMLSDRFRVVNQRILQHPEIDGVHESIGVEFSDTSAERQYQKLGKPYITGIKREVQPNELLDALIHSKANGYFHLNGLTIHRRVFLKTGYLFPFRYCEDSTFTLRLAFKCAITQGERDQLVAKRVIHGHNSITSNQQRIQKESVGAYLTLLDWSLKQSPVPKKLVKAALIRLGAYEKHTDLQEHLPSHRDGISRTGFVNRLYYQLLRWKLFMFVKQRTELFRGK